MPAGVGEVPAPADYQHVELEVLGSVREIHAGDAGLGEAWEIYAPGTEAHAAIEAATGDVFSSVVTRLDFPTALRYQSEEK